MLTQANFDGAIDWKSTSCTQGMLPGDVSTYVQVGVVLKHNTIAELIVADSAVFCQNIMAAAGINHNHVACSPNMITWVLLHENMNPFLPLHSQI